MIEYGITQLEKSIKRLAKKYEKEGYETEIDVFKSGNAMPDASYVELTIKYEDKHGRGTHFSREFLAYGYSSNWSHTISTADGMPKAKKEFNKAFEHMLKLRAA